MPFILQAMSFLGEEEVGEGLGENTIVGWELCSKFMMLSFLYKDHTANNIHPG